jgi:hypothetical protein
MSPVGEIEKSLRHLDKASLISGICNPFRERHALCGIPTIFVCCIRQTYPVFQKQKSRRNKKFR